MRLYSASRRAASLAKSSCPALCASSTAIVAVATACSMRQRPRQVAVRLGVVRLQPDRFRVVLDLAGHVSLGGEDVPDVEMSLRQVGLDAERFTVMIHRFIEIAALSECIAQVGVRLGEV